MDGQEYKVKPTRTKLVMRRIFFLSEAEKLLKSEVVSIQVVELVWKDRSVKVDSNSAFVENQHDQQGSFVAPYQHLQNKIV